MHWSWFFDFVLFFLLFMCHLNLIFTVNEIEINTFSLKGPCREKLQPVYLLLYHHVNILMLHSSLENKSLYLMIKSVKTQLFPLVLWKRNSKLKRNKASCVFTYCMTCMILFFFFFSPADIIKQAVLVREGSVFVFALTVICTQTCTLMSLRWFSDEEEKALMPVVQDRPC